MMMLLAVISFTEIVINPDGSTLLNNSLIASEWIVLIIVSSIAAGLSYTLLSMPSSIIAVSVITTRKGVIVAKGLIGRTEESIPYSAIKNVHVEQSPLQKAFNIVDINFETKNEDESSIKLDVNAANKLIDNMQLQLYS